MFKCLPLLTYGLRRRPWRTTFTAGAIVVAFCLLGVSEALRASLSGPMDLSEAVRLFTVPKLSPTQPLPVAYAQAIAKTPGVRNLSYLLDVDGVFGDRKISVLAATLDTHLQIFSQIKIPAAARTQLLADKQGVIVGSTLAAEQGWKAGDRISVRSSRYRKRDGSDAWEANIIAIYDLVGTSPLDTSTIYMHYAYIDDALDTDHGRVSAFAVSLDPSAHIADVIRAIDSRFANSTHETKTYTEGMIMREIAERFANIEGVSSFIALSVFLTVVLVTLQTMMQSLRERSGEIAVLRTLGFSRRRISRLLIGESLLLAGVSGGIGLGLAYLLIQAVRAPLALYLPYFGLTSSAVASAAVAVLALGLIAVAYPAIRALRIPIADALRAG